MKSFLTFISEVEGPRSELDKKVFREHPVKTTDIVPKNAGVFDVKTVKDKSRKADRQPDDSKKTYRAENGLEPEDNEDDLKTGSVYSRQATNQYYRTESFKSVQDKIAKSAHVSKASAGAILASASRNASPEAKRKNPKLLKVKEDIDSILDQLDEVSKERLRNYMLKAKDSMAAAQVDTHKAYAGNHIDDVKGMASSKKYAKRWVGMNTAIHKATGGNVKIHTTEEAETTDNLLEVSKERLKAYVDKASRQLPILSKKIYSKDNTGDDSVYYARKKENRSKGIVKAKTSVDEELDNIIDTLQLDEVSSERLRNYIHAAKDDTKKLHTIQNKADSNWKSASDKLKKRTRGIVAATKKFHAEETTISEATAQIKKWSAKHLKNVIASMDASAADAVHEIDRRGGK